MTLVSAAVFAQARCKAVCHSARAGRLEVWLMSSASKSGSSGSRASMSDVDSDASEGAALCGGDSGSEEMQMCFLCGQDDNLGNLPKMLGGQLFHNKCFLVNNAYRREIKGNAQLQLKHKHNFQHNASA